MFIMYQQCKVRHRKLFEYHWATSLNDNFWWLNISIDILKIWEKLIKTFQCICLLCTKYFHWYFENMIKTDWNISTHIMYQQCKARNRKWFEHHWVTPLNDNLRRQNFLKIWEKNWKVEFLWKREKKFEWRTRLRKGGMLKLDGDLNAP